MADEPTTSAANVGNPRQASYMALAHWRALRDVVVSGVVVKAGDTFEASRENIGFAAFAHGMVERIETKKKKKEG
jgi:hypothetical protein